MRSRKTRGSSGRLHDADHALHAAYLMSRIVTSRIATAAFGLNSAARELEAVRKPVLYRHTKSRA